jgi:hypothetical protein
MASLSFGVPGSKWTKFSEKQPEAIEKWELILLTYVV